ncbi:MAG: biopolymer transporter ExbD [Alphaproteobacteria bacterium]|nr:biopolymer transporter ExbD [Alphaproteobacteria bacterium]MCB9791449.1 biopolymer transporter ExbD [Alphaproteobacteria bacterium]
MHRPSEGKHENAALIPFMSLASLLIPMLLMGAQFVTLGIIDTQLPAICSAGCGDTPVDEEPLNLTVAITRSGLVVTGNDPRLQEPIELPCARQQCLSEADYDAEGLTRLLSDLKDEHPQEQAMIVVPEGEVSYGALITVFDAARGSEEAPLFPSPTIAGGAV